MGILSWIVVGAIAGWLAGMLVKGDESLGFIGHIGLGIVGGLVGGFIAGLLTGGKDYTTGINLPTIVVAVVGGFSGLGLRPLHCQGQGHSRQMCLHVQPAGSSVVATATTSPGRVVPSPSSKEKLNCHHHGRNRSWASGSSGSTLRGAGQLPRT